MGKSGITQSVGSYLHQAPGLECIPHAVDEITVRHQTFSDHLWHLSEQKSICSANLCYIIRKSLFNRYTGTRGLITCTGFHVTVTSNANIP